MRTGREPMGEETEARVREQAQRVQQQVERQGEQVKGTVASGLHTAAQRLREQSMQMGRPGLAARVAEPMERSAQYLESRSLPQIGEDARRTAREHPFWAAAGVFATAFLVGRLLRRR